jgi:hypothetical protein
VLAGNPITPSAISEVVLWGCRLKLVYSVNPRFRDMACQHFSLAPISYWNNSAICVRCENPIKFRESLAKTPIVECDHKYENNVCIYCKDCNHRYENNVCTRCGKRGNVMDGLLRFAEFLFLDAPNHGGI